MKKNLHNNQKGFTIIETLVAISILVLALTGPLSIVAQSLKTSYYSRDQVAAFYLAQEAVEYIRNTRDQNALRYPNDPTQWLQGISNPNDFQGSIGATLNCINDTPTGEANKCSLVRRFNTYVFLACASSGCAPLTFSETSGVYGDLASNTASPFSRSIFINKLSSNPNASREVVINVVVKWRSGGSENQFTLRENLTNWKTDGKPDVQ